MARDNTPMEPKRGFNDLPAHQDYDRLDTSTNETWAEGMLARLDQVRKVGLDRVYIGQVSAFVADVYGGDFPWDDERHDAVVRIVRSDPRWAAFRAWFKQLHGAEFPDALTTAEVEALGMV